MCTAIALNTEDFYFGRNLDLEYGFGERVVITPRNFPFEFRMAGEMRAHYAVIGMATVMDGYPLYAEACNEKGLCIAGLNFPQNAHYPEGAASYKVNISPFELTAWLLGQCADVREAREVLSRTHLTRMDFSREVRLSPLHWMISDKNGSITVECMRDGLHIHDNPVGVLTNNPPFEFHMTNLRQYLNLTSGYPENRFHSEVKLSPFGVGLGSIGLPGDFSPVSRFVKTVFLKYNLKCERGEMGSIAGFFHLLDSVAMPDGAVMTQSGLYEYTRYSSCINADKGIFYYKTYRNGSITAVDMRREDLDGDSLRLFELNDAAQIAYAN